MDPIKLIDSGAIGEAVISEEQLKLAERRKGES
jgi:hypothetical protein